MVSINKIIWISKPAAEAEVHLSDGKFSLICFSQPFKEELDEDFSSLLHTFNAKDLYKIKGRRRASVERIDGGFSYKLAGKVIDKLASRIKIGGYIVELDYPLPGDVRAGHYVSFHCERIDIY